MSAATAVFRGTPAIALVLLGACVSTLTGPDSTALSITNVSADTLVAIPYAKSVGETSNFAFLGAQPDSIAPLFGSRVIGPKATVRIPFDSLRLYTKGTDLTIVTTRLVSGVTRQLRAAGFTASELEKSGYSVSVSAP